MADMLTFNRTPLRAWVVVPGNDPKRDFCEVRQGGYPIEGDQSPMRGPLETILFRLRADARGLPVTIHPECLRRAGL